MKKLSLTLLAAVACWSGSAFADAVLNSGQILSAGSPEGDFLAVRMRNQNSGHEIYLGTPDLGAVDPDGPGGVNPRVTQNVNYGTSNDFTFTWDPNADLLTFGLFNGTTLYPTMSYTTVDNFSTLNYFEFWTRENGADPAAVELTVTNLVLDGVNVTGIGSVPNTQSSFFHLSPGDLATAGINLTDGFTLTGTLGRVGSGGSAERANLEIRAGYREAAVVPIPGAAGLGLLGMALVGIRRRMRKVA